MSTPENEGTREITTKSHFGTHIATHQITARCPITNQEIIIEPESEFTLTTATSRDYMGTINGRTRICISKTLRILVKE